MTRLLWFALLFLLYSVHGSYAQSVWGVELMVQDGASSSVFFRQGLGFEPVVRTPDTWQLMTKDDAFLLLTISDADETNTEPGLELNYQVGDLTRATSRCLGAGGRLTHELPQQSAIGPFNRIQIPGCEHAINLMEIDDHALEPDAIRVFNASLSVPDLTVIEPVFADFGFTVYSRDYLPATLPFQRLGRLALVAHSAAVEHNWTSSALLFSVDDIAQATRQLPSTTLAPGWDGLQGTATGPWFSLGPVRGKLINPAAWLPSPVDDQVQAAFARLKSMLGTWRGTSTAGWTSDVQYRAIARGTTLVGTSFDDHHEDAMMTVFYIDGSELLLTHYCVARNQPQLRLANSSPDGARLTFEFIGGGNLATRDRGHMDSVVIEFKGPDAFTSRWQWYQNGRNTWMEEVTYRRVADPTQSHAGK